MRKISTFLLLTMLIVCFGFTSCNNDDDESSIGNKDLIYGAWQLSWEEGYEGGDNYSESVSSLRYYYFDKNQNFIVYRKDRDTGKWEEYDSGTYTIDPSTETFTMNKNLYTLLTLTSSTLKIKETWEYKGEQEYQIQTFKKVNDSLLPEL